MIRFFGFFVFLYPQISNLKSEINAQASRPHDSRHCKTLRSLSFTSLIILIILHCTSYYCTAQLIRFLHLSTKLLCTPHYAEVSCRATQALRADPTQTQATATSTSATPSLCYCSLILSLILLFPMLQ